MNKDFFIRMAMTLTISAPPAAFGEYIQGHSCSPPLPQLYQGTFSQLDFDMQVDSYKACIEKYVDEQESEIKDHKNAADKAVKDWNDFVSATKAAR